MDGRIKDRKRKRKEERPESRREQTGKKTEGGRREDKAHGREKKK